MDEAFLGQIIMFAGNYAPTNWALCNGQLLAISQYSALYSIIGTIYGGDGITNFALPNLQGRVAIHPGNGTGLSPYKLGEQGGVETVALTIDQIPSHRHGLMAYSGNGDQPSPSGNVSSVIVDSAQAESQGYSNASPNTALSTAAITAIGGNLPHSNLQPFLTVNFLICTNGIYPTRP